MKTISTSVTNKGQVSSRVEVLVRLVYWIPLFVVMYILQILYALAWIVNIGSVIVRGMRSARVSSFIKRVLDYQYKFAAYYSFLTDERPPILPE